MGPNLWWWGWVINLLCFGFTWILAFKSFRSQLATPKHILGENRTPLKVQNTYIGRLDFVIICIWLWISDLILLLERREG